MNFKCERLESKPSDGIDFRLFDFVLRSSLARWVGSGCATIAATSPAKLIDIVICGACENRSFPVLLTAVGVVTSIKNANEIEIESRTICANANMRPTSANAYSCMYINQYYADRYALLSTKGILNTFATRNYYYYSPGLYLCGAERGRGEKRTHTA